MRISFSMHSNHSPKRPRRKKAGLAPGTLIHVGQQRVSKAKISLIEYSGTKFEEKELEGINKSLSESNKETISWINIDGVHDVSIFEDIGQAFGIHPLVLEDCLNTDQRPKLDEYEEYLFVVIKMLYLGSTKPLIEQEQISLIVGRNFVFSFQEKEGDVFSAVRERIRMDRGRIRKAGSDYLAYALIDAVVDHYFIVADELTDRIGALDAQVLSEPSPDVLQKLHHLKREILGIRKNIAPLREVVSRLYKGDIDLVNDSTEIYFGDIFDHILQVIESVDSHREMLSNLIDLYLSYVSNRTNETMKILTIMTAIFIPISFVAGLYGMNFEIMPELKWKYGYVCVLGLMISIVSSMLLFFRKKKWI
jgi:magnesium transporter